MVKGVLGNVVFVQFVLFACEMGIMFAPSKQNFASIVRKSRAQETSRFREEAADTFKLRCLPLEIAKDIKPAAGS
jgi:hypothetical protein